MSFSDMMESGRGPGVIGSLLAAAVLAGFACLFLFAFDSRFLGGDQSIESKINHQETEIDNLRLAIETRAQTNAKLQEFARIQHALATTQAQVEDARQDLASKENQLAALQGELDGYKDRYRAQVRNGAKGEELGKLELPDGTTYLDVTIREVTPVGLHIRHRDGFKRIPYEILPAAIQDRFLFDPLQKQAAIALEHAQQQEYDTAVANANQGADKQATEARQRATAEAKKKLRESLMSQEKKILTLENDIRQLRMEIQMERYKPLSRAPQMRDRLTAKERELAELKAVYSRMSSSM